MLSPQQPLAVYMQDSLDGPYGKMGFGVLRYSPNPIACVIDRKYAGRRTGEFRLAQDVPIVGTVSEARALGAEVFVLGIAPLGGVIPSAWYADIDAAVALGMSVLNGLHEALAPRYLARDPGQWVWDIRTEPAGLVNGAGRAAQLNNVRVLFIGTDMAIGKMTAGLELHRAARDLGWRSHFVATGQIGITVTGAGIPLDAIRVDFASGAVEQEVLREPDAEVVWVEGQGSLLHPSSTANLPLIRGTVPTHFVLCHRAGQTHLRTADHIRIPSLGEVIRLYEQVASAAGTWPTPVTLGVCLNTADLSEAEARAAVKSTEDELGLPVTDVLRFGVEPVLTSVASARSRVG